MTFLFLFCSRNFQREGNKGIKERREKWERNDDDRQKGMGKGYRKGRNRARDIHTK
jgi:hypothetical protein